MKVYHGTSAARWAGPDPAHRELYVTLDPVIARRYADEWSDPLVVEICLQRVLAIGGVELLSNAENAAQCDAGHWDQVPGKAGHDLTWDDTMAMSGTGVIKGFGRRHKLAATVMSTDGSVAADLRIDAMAIAGYRFAAGTGSMPELLDDLDIDAFNAGIANHNGKHGTHVPRVFETMKTRYGAHETGRQADKELAIVGATGSGPRLG
jgi:hypothetical protein